MKTGRPGVFVSFLAFVFLTISRSFSLCAQAPLDGSMARDPHQAIDQQYTAKIQQYTTGSDFTSPLVNYLPASSTVPTPMKVLGDVAGAPDMLPYAEDVYKYFRMLAASSPRVKVVTIGHTEEGREMIAAAVADEDLLNHQKENDARLAQLADPRSLGMDDAKARPLIDASYPVYYITGTIHSPETGAPTALMELAYRLAVDDAPYIKYIRSHMIVLITPVVEVDGRDRMVDVYKWHKAHPGQDWPRLVYWGHYVAHDNNRDAMGMTLDLTRNVLDTFVGWHAQVLHDLHESVPLLYDNTVGDGPYNAWIDPTLADEWAELGWNNTAQMQSLNMPGVFTHGDFDTWSPGYLMFLAGLHNGISRLYETFGNGGADTEKRILTPEQYSRTWYRQSPPPPVLTWSQRDNNNYEESALLTTLSYFSRNTHHFLENYYRKSKRTIQKPTLEGPAAYVLPANPAEANRQAQLLQILKLQHVELQQLSSEVKVTLPATKRGDKPVEVTLPPGSAVVRMDQPFARIADALLDRQYWAPDDPQKHPYDDTGWSFSELFNLRSVRVTDAGFLTSKMSPLADPATLAGKSAGSGGVYVIPNTGQTNLLGFAYKLKGQHITVAEKAFEADGKHMPSGSLLVSDVREATVIAALKASLLDAVQLRKLPDVAAHPLVLPRIAFMHSWQATQTEGWWRYAFDRAGIPFDYISTQNAGQLDLHSKYDVILFAPVGHASTDQLISGTPRYGNTMPWRKTDLTPNLGGLDETDDIRPGMGYDGLEHLKAFVEGGGLLITCEDTAQFAIDTGLAPGVTLAPHADTRVVGSVLQSVIVNPEHPVAWGYGTNLPVMSADGMIFNVSNTIGRSGGRALMDPYQARPTGRGSVGDDDVPQGRTPVAPVIPAQTKPWEPRPLNEEQLRNNPSVIPPALRPEVVLRFAETKDLLRSGLLDKGGSIAEHAVVVVAHLGKGQVLLFGNNPLYRGETIGSYPLVFNALMSFDHLQHLPPGVRPGGSNALPGPGPGVTPASQPVGRPGSPHVPDGQP
jgi:hypothetical protein